MRHLAYGLYRRRRAARRRQLRQRATGVLLAVLYLAYRATAAWYQHHHADVARVAAWTGPLLLALLLAATGLGIRYAMRARTRRLVGPATLAAIAPAPGERSTGRDFERMVAGLLERDGATGVEVVGGSRDRGADVTGWLRRPRRWRRLGRRRVKVVVQCKHYADTDTVGSGDMQKFLGTVRLIHAAEIAVFATTAAGFTSEARALAERGRVVLVAGPELLYVLAGQRPLVPASATAPALAAAPSIGEPVT